MGNIVNGVDSWMSANLKYSDDEFACINSNFHTNTPEEHSISGSKASIIIHEPAHCPTSFTLKQFGNSRQELMDAGYSSRDLISKVKYEFSLPKGFPYDYFTFPGSSGLYYEVEEVVNCLDKAVIESAECTHKESIITAQILDEIRKQIGVIYAQDKELSHIFF